MNARASVSVAICTLLLFIGPGAAQTPKRKRVDSVKAKPKLVLLIVVDQFRYDYLQRFGDLFGANGFRNLLRNGASWEDANYDHVPTFTAPGHATLMTGAWPSETGIIANDWPDRASGSVVSNCSDPDDGTGKTVTLLGAPGAGSSPRRLMASTVGDELKLATVGRSIVMGISLKNRAAIMPVGRSANAAYWFSAENGNMVSSTYYLTQLPGWVDAFNQEHQADKFFGAKWERLLPATEYARRAGPDAPPWEVLDKEAAKADTNSFPHIIKGGQSQPGKEFYAALDATPFANDILLEFAERAISSEHLGQDDAPDLLSISFSANDYIGHRFGPYSQEVMDVSLRTDRQIAALLQYIDLHVGLANTLVIFTADHGVAPVPEQAAAVNLDGARVEKELLMRTIRNAWRTRFGPAAKHTDDYIQKFRNDDGKLQDGYANGNLYLDYEAISGDGVNIDDVERTAGEAALTLPGYSRYFTRTQLINGAISDSDQVARRVLHGFYPKRSGDVVLVTDAFKFPFTRDATTHGGPYSYDSHVPLIIMGPGIKPGRYLQAASPADIAPTISIILQIQKPSNATGRVLLEAMAEPRP